VFVSLAHPGLARSAGCAHAQSWVVNHAGRITLAPGDTEAVIPASGAAALIFHGVNALTSRELIAPLH
jgi:hypothetical protein